MEDLSESPTGRQILLLSHSIDLRMRFLFGVTACCKSRRDVCFVATSKLLAVYQRSAAVSGDYRSHTGRAIDAIHHGCLYSRLAVCALVTAEFDRPFHGIVI